MHTGIVHSIGHVVSNQGSPLLYVLVNFASPELLQQSGKVQPIAKQRQVIIFPVEIYSGRMHIDLPLAPVKLSFLKQDCRGRFYLKKNMPIFNLDISQIGTGKAQFLPGRTAKNRQAGNR